MPPTYTGQLGPEPRHPEQTFWDPEMQTMPPEQRRALQLERLHALVGRALDHPVPMFERKLAEAGIDSAEAITGLDEINLIPTTVKQELRDSEAESPPWGDYRFVPQRECVRMGQSTGTTGTPTVALLTRRDIWLEYESAARTWWRNGWRPGQIVTHAHPSYLYGGGVMLSGSLEYFGALNLWVEPPETDEVAEQAIKLWHRVHPDVSFVAFSLGRFQEVAAKLGYDGTGLPAFELRGADDRGLPFMTAGFECYAYAGGPCGVEPGGHIHEDWAIVQAVDPKTGRDVADGKWGNLVVTTLDRDNALLRYDLEEAVNIIREPCACGETTARAFWGGRFKDFLDVQGRYFNIGEIERSLRAVRSVTEPTLEYVVIKPTDPAAPLRIRVELLDEHDRDAARDSCTASINERIGIDAAVEVVERESLARSGYKAVRLVDR